MADIHKPVSSGPIKLALLVSGTLFVMMLFAMYRTEQAIDAQKSLSGCISQKPAAMSLDRARFECATTVSTGSE